MKYTEIVAPDYFDMEPKLPALRLRAILRPYRTIRSLQRANCNQVRMLDDQRRTVAGYRRNFDTAVKTMRDSELRVSELGAELQAERQATEDLAAHAAGMREQICNQKAIIKLLHANDGEGYSAGLHQGHHDAMNDMLGPCPECGSSAPLWPHDGDCPNSRRG
jgi:hypothetical protein